MPRSGATWTSPSFVALLETGALHFARTDTLGDPFEGSATLAVIEDRKRQMAEADWVVDDYLERSEKSLRDSAARLSVSCWNRSALESDALWNLYAPAGGGLAIRTTFGRLSRCFGAPLGPDETNPDPPNIMIGIGSVQYIDYDTGLWPETNAFYPVLHKRLSFQHEQEVRAIVHDFGSEGPAPASRLVAVDLQTLVDTVVVSPVAPDWFADLVDAVAARYELGAPVTQSALAASPRF